jgi:glycosyl transferase family 2/glycosyl transferase family 87
LKVNVGHGPRFGWRRSLFLLAVMSLLTLCIAIGELPQIHAHPVWRIVTFFLLLAACLATTFTWPRTGTPRIQAAGILLLALVVRLALAPHPVDSDANRYLWEGRLIREGYDPYSHVASAPEWANQRDAYWEGMNQKALRTIYPPIAEWTFAAIGGLWYHPAALKAVFIVFDLGSIALLLAMLSTRSQPLRLAGLYAFNPVPLIGFAAEGHFDAMLIFFVLLALSLRERRYTALSWIALGLAVQTKLVAVLLAPLFARRGGWRTAWVGAATAVLPFLPYSADINPWLSGVHHFGADLGFNGSIHALASMAFGSRASAAALCAAILVLWIALVTFLDTDLWHSAFFVFGGLIALSPIVHYWYVSWALVFVPLFPSLAWITLSGTMALYFLVGLTPDWSMPLWGQLVIWTTFGIMLSREGLLALGPLLAPKIRAKPSKVRSLAVVVPALNESKMLSNCLLSLARMSPRPIEVIVVDGGSVDDTPEIAARLGATVVSCDPGRGQQIAAGVAETRSDVVLVLHADSEIAPDTGSRILAALNTRPEAVGGAVGQRFDRDAPSLCVIECLNEIRAVLLGLSFGDQGQFFHRATIMAGGGFPNLPLMEDVELSLRLQAAGRMLYLGGGLVCSGRQWRQKNWLQRCSTVIAMTTIYLLRRREGAHIAHILYRRYYPAAALRVEHDLSTIR